MKKIVLIFCITVFLATGCTSKPSKEAVRKAFGEALVSKLGSSPTADQKAAVTTYSDCLVDEVYSELSASTLQKFIKAKNFADFENVKGTKKEQEVLDGASQKCSKDLLNANK